MSRENPKPRIDPENLMSLKDFHAPRALGRKGKDGKPEFEGLDPEARRAKIADPETPFREGEPMRKALLNMLNRLEGNLSPEQQKLLDGLLGQCEQAASVWTEKYPVKNAPSQAAIIASAEKWLISLPAEVLQGLVELCPDSSQLVVLPGGVTTLEQMQAIDKTKTVRGQTDGEIWNHELWAKVQADGWGFGITDVREDIPYDPSVFWFNPEEPDEGKRKKRTNEEMVAEYERRFAEKNLGLMPQHGCVPTEANRLAQGKVLDREFYTAFKRPQGAEFMPRVAWNNCVNLGNGHPDHSTIYVRCRPWLEGNMADFN